MAHELMAINYDDDDDVDTPPATTATDVWAFAMTVIEVLPFILLRKISHLPTSFPRPYAATDRTTPFPSSQA
jgi:hypothetical protein